jgi:hypothetical protein
VIEYENTRRIAYGTDDDECGKATFVPVCTECGRFVKADASIRFADSTIADEPNATCRKCGRVQMLFEGFI